MNKWGGLGQAMQLSWTLLFSLLLPLLIGIWLDERMDTSPLFVLIGAGLGILAATVGVARMAIRMFRQSERDAPDQGGTDGQDEEEAE